MRTQFGLLLVLLTFAFGRALGGTVIQEFSWPEYREFPNLDFQRTLEFECQPFDSNLGDLNDIRVTLHIDWHDLFVFGAGVGANRGQGHCLGTMQIHVATPADSLCLLDEPFHQEIYVTSGLHDPVNRLRVDRYYTYDFELKGGEVAWGPFIATSAPTLMLTIDVTHAYTFTAPSSYPGGYVVVDWSGVLRVYYHYNEAVQSPANSFGEIKCLFR